ncbi:MAG: VTT domain-containing protein [Phycisphaerae bacterium]|nr:VTT domain-containing protein [Phycisphaerae bacterium]
MKTTVVLVLLFAAGFVLVGNRRFEHWLKGRAQTATTSQPATAGDEETLELSDQSVQWVDHHRKLAAMAVMVLLGSDMFLPVPSSVVMTTNGRLFGFATGTMVSFAGSMLAWIGCYWLGRLFGWTGQKKNGDGPSGDAVSRQVKRFGGGMLIVTRPVPILAELTAAACGVARMNFWRFLVGASLGVLPMSIVYAYVGNHYRDSRSPWIALVIAILIPLLLYLALARPWRKRSPA